VVCLAIVSSVLVLAAAAVPVSPVVVEVEPVVELEPLMSLPGPDPVVPVPVGALSLGPKPMFIAARTAAALFAELYFFAHVAIARRVCGP
jgi:hypothetical protein